MGFLKLVRQLFKRIFDRIRNEKVKANLLQAIPFWVASLLAGLIAVLYTRLFGYAEKGTLYIATHGTWWLFIITPACFFLSWLIVARCAPYARGSGIPQVMAAIDLATPKYIRKVDKLLSLRIIFIKILSSLVMVLGGGVIGREGPTIQIAGSVFRKVHSWLPGWWPKISKKNMIMTGAAAGLAAAFNTPLGGIVFAVEELTKTHINYFKTAIFTAVIIAGLTAQGLLGPYLYLGYPDVSHFSTYIIVLVALVAAVTGLSGSMMAKIILNVLRWKKHFKSWQQHCLYVVTCALVIVCIAYFVDGTILGSGKSLMTQTLFTNEKYVSWHSAVFRALGPILCFTTGASGGVFAPSLSAGAGIGSMLSGWFHLSAANTNIVILAGMAGFLTGVTRSPFTSAILVLEMTDRHNLIFHLMLASMIASIVSMIIDKHSLYDHLKTDYIHDLHHEDDNSASVKGDPAIISR
jgi:chloride channel protein, CIC family